MRTLCLRFPRDIAPSAAEAFLTFSPRVHYRAPGLIFADVTSSARVLGGEGAVLERALGVAASFAADVAGAVADTPWGAQALTIEKPGVVGLARREFEELSRAPLARLKEFEGLIAWRSSAQVDKIADMLHLLGLREVGELRRFGIESFRDRWGETGELIWKRLNGLDRQVISPLLPTEALEDFVHLDFPVTSLGILLGHLEGSLTRLLSRLAGRGEYATVITLKLFCEYSGKIHVVDLRPASPGRDLALFTKLLENKLQRVGLDNPIQQISTGVIPCPEKAQQLSFFEPRVSDAEKLGQLVSVFRQASISTGFLRLHDEIIPEDSWSLTPEYEPHSLLNDVVERDGVSFQIRPAYAHGLARAPRPSRLLRTPLALSDVEFGRYRLLSHQPIERLEDGWWEDIKGRDYYFARSPRGEYTWLFFDRSERRYYLHGYFD